MDIPEIKTAPGLPENAIYIIGHDVLSGDRKKVNPLKSATIYNIKKSGD